MRRFLGRFHCFLKTGQPLFIFQVKGFQIGKAIENKQCSTKKFREHEMEILYLGGLKQTFYFDTGRLQGYPLCEIDFFHFLIGFSIRD